MNNQSAIFVKPLHRLFVLVAISGTMLLAWLIYPPFPHPNELANLSQVQLETILGKPTVKMPDKFVFWSTKRLGFEWSIEASAPISADAVPGYVSRTLWLQIPKSSVRLFNETVNSQMQNK